ncbi:MAG: hypothetical protein ACRCWQ_14265, partial [Bacilli bacterium]
MIRKVLYHGSYRERGEEIRNNKKVPITKGDWHWLGDGIYFYEFGYNAYKWIVHMFRDRFSNHQETVENLISKYMVLEVDIQVDENRIFNLENPEHRFLLLETIEKVKSMNQITIKDGTALNFLYTNHNGFKEEV